ncbi:MAG TPA: ABC transporter substrate-binding protein [Thermoanaerobaculaceae bacterium]|nr:ABC transporter substrate-binding protein [Thermoanaerobaculaceae bacterium]HRS17386.1 ABC transporter substrate-binding protein [Thermoanaerobaculaceae bacterium]
MKTAIRLVGAAALAAVLGGCGGGGGATGGGQELIVAIPADVETFNEYQSTGESLENAIIDLLFPTLFEEQPDFAEHPPTFLPRLATAWQFSTDGRVLRVKLRQDAFWSNGFRVTAEDVRFTLMAQKSQEAGSLFVEQKAAIRSLEVLDAFTFQVHFSRVYPYQLMDLNDGHIIPVNAWGGTPFPEWPHADFTPSLVSCGPFRLASRTPQQTTVLERDSRHWNPPQLERLVLRVIPDSAAQVRQLLAGRVHFIPMVAPRDADRLQKSDKVKVVGYPSRLLGFLAWNNRRPPLGDARVRRALTLAINRAALVDAVYLGHASVASGPVLSSMWAFDRTLAPLPYDPEGARQLFADAGWRDGDGDGVLDREGRRLALELLYPATNSLRAQMAVLIQADLAKVGVAASPRPVEFGALMARQESGDFDAVLAAWEEATKVDLASGWATASAEAGSGNFFGYSNPELDRVLADVAAAPDLERARVLLARAQQLIVADQPVTFLYEARQLVAFSSRLTATPNPALVFFGIANWTMSPP